MKVPFGQKFYDELIDEKEEFEAQIEKLEGDLTNVNVDLHHWVHNQRKQFELLETDVVIDMPTPFVIRFERDSIIMISMKYLGGDIKIFKEEILRNVD